MRRIGLSALALFVATCGLEGPTSTIPPGAQQVHVTVTGDEVRVDPMSVRAGDIYLVLDIPDGATVIFVATSTEGSSGGPLTADAIARVGQGDVEGTVSTVLSVGGDAALRAQRRGRMGFGGNVYMEPLVAGTYAILLPPPERNGPPSTGAQPLSVAILTVTP